MFEQALRYIVDRPETRPSIQKAKEGLADAYRWYCDHRGDLAA